MFSVIVLLTIVAAAVGQQMAYNTRPFPQFPQQPPSQYQPGHNLRQLSPHVSMDEADGIVIVEDKVGQGSGSALGSGFGRRAGLNSFNGGRPEISGTFETRFQEATLWKNQNVTHLKSYQTRGTFQGKWNKNAGKLLRRMLSGSSGPMAPPSYGRHHAKRLPVLGGHRQQRRYRRQAPPGAEAPANMPGGAQMPGGAGGKDIGAKVKTIVENIGKKAAEVGKKIGSFFDNLFKPKGGAAGQPGGVVVPSPPSK